MAPTGPSEPPRADAPRQPAPRPVSTPSILVVDDDPSVLSLIDYVLRRAGAEVTAVAGGHAALRAMADGTCRPTLLLTDIEMPEMTGIELAARAAALKPGIRVVMMTGDFDSAQAARDRPELVLHVLLKPITIGELLEATELAPSEPGRR